MIRLRAFISFGMIAIGATVVVRMLEQGLQFAIVPGLVLGGAMIGLGFHRLALLRRMGGKA